MPETFVESRHSLRIQGKCIKQVQGGVNVRGYQRRLPRELVSLIHVVELNKAGWREHAVDQLILYAIHKRDEPMTLEAIYQYIHLEFELLLPETLVRDRISVLAAAGQIVIQHDKRLLLSPDTALEVSGRVKAGEHLDKQVKDSFTALASECGLDVTWEDFRDKFLLPLIREAGARTRHLLTGDTTLIPESQSYMKYVETLTPPQQESLNRCIERVLNGDNALFRDFILQNMYAYFSLHAVGFDDSGIRALQNLKTGRPTVHILVDTNVLFSILDLHDNPSNDAAVVLHSLAKKLDEFIDIKFAVLPDTLQEAKRTLIGYEERLHHISVTPNVARSVRAAGASVSGIVARYLQATREAEYRLSAKDYLEPYINHLDKFCRQHGIELLDEDTSTIADDQRVIDDILQVQEFETARYGDKAKTYETVKHDVVLWHVAHKLRGKLVEDPLGAGYWVVTLDFRLLGFDSHKRKELGRRIPVCVHPSSLVQMLHFLMPRTQESEAALITSLRSMLAQEVDPESELVTLKILGALSRYENVDDFPEDTLREMLLNDALREKLRNAESVEQEVELVREELASEAARLREELDAAQHEKGILAEELRIRIEALEQLQQERDLLGSKMEQATWEIQRRKEREDDLIRRIDELEREVAAARDDHRRAEHSIAVWRKQVACSVTSLISIAGTLWGGHHIAVTLAETLHFDLFLVRAVTVGVGLLLCSVAIDFIWGRDPDLSSWKVLVIFRGYRKILGAITLSIISGYAERFIGL